MLLYHTHVTPASQTRFQAPLDLSSPSLFCPVSARPAVSHIRGTFWYARVFLRLCSSLQDAHCLQMYVACNSQDRTVGHFVSLAADSGWKVVEVHHIPGSSFGQYVSVPM